MNPGDPLVLQVSANREGLDLDGLLQNPGSIPREALFAMSRGPLKRYLSDGFDVDSTYVDRVRRLWIALLATMRDDSVLDGHMTGVCNAICVFLHSTSSSPVRSVQIFAMSADIWTETFEVLLHKFDNSKPKPLRQVLNTLIKILGQHGDRNKAQCIEEAVLCRLGSIILLGKSVSHFKASMVIFEAFIHSGVPASRVLFAIGRSHGENCDQQYHRLNREGINVVELSVAKKRSTVDEAVYHFCFSIILAVADGNAQTTAGTFFTSVMSMLTEHDLSLDSMWVEIVITILHRYPRAIEAFKNYLLPAILKMHPDQCYDLLHGMTSYDADSSMLENAITIATLGFNAGLLLEEGTFRFLG
jgi:hypothetical protein